MKEKYIKFALVARDGRRFSTIIRALFNDRHSLGYRWMYKWPFTELKKQDPEEWKDLVDAHKIHPDWMIREIRKSRKGEKRGIHVAD